MLTFTVEISIYTHKNRSVEYKQSENSICNNYENQLHFNQDCFVFFLADYLSLRMGRPCMAVQLQKIIFTVL